jgi:predicted acetyltransferase
LNHFPIIPVTKDNVPIYHNLAQCYEAEFSPLTGKKPDASGLFALDTLIGGEVLGYLYYIDGTPAGLAAITQTKDDHFEVSEFYIVPLFRKGGSGMDFAHAIWRRHGGTWEVKQLEGAEYATAFWRKTIARYDNTPFSEERYDDPYWGRVLRQTFTIAR